LRTIALVSILALSAAAVVALACDGGRVTLNDATTHEDASAGDAASIVDAAEELILSGTCGAPPWVSLRIGVLAASLDNPDGSPLPGATFTSPLCPGYGQVTDDAGMISAQVSKNVPFYARLEATNYIKMLSPEESFAGDSTSLTITMLPKLYGVILPDAGPNGTAIAIAMHRQGADAAACNDYDGVSFAVDGHPEASVTYYSNDTIPAPTDGGVTTARGFAVITGLAPNQMVTVTATKPGCTVAFNRESSTGRIPLESGYVSLVLAYLSD
jgi:hypothetical protein